MHAEIGILGRLSVSRRPQTEYAVFFRYPAFSL